jgi:thiamine pyrophosphate-dependent acetolactate synthase large subunit-like protein
LEAEPEHQRTVTDVMAETFVNWGVTSVFGMVGHSNLGLADAVRRRTVDGEMNYYGIRHEGAASFACSGYAKLTGLPAACLAIAGPGATNLVTGLWDAKVDRAPVLALTGQVQVQVFGPGAFQDIDLKAAFAPVTQFSQNVLHTSNHAELANLACKAALDNRDVAHLIFPDDIQTLPAADDAKAGKPAGRMANMSIAPSAESLGAAVNQLQAAKRPLIIVGYGANSAMSDIVTFAEQHNVPVATTFKGKGQIADNHPLAAGVLGRSGTPIASWFMNECDVILALGASFSNHTGIEKSKPIIQVDFDPAQLGRFHPIAVPVLGEIGVTMRALKTALKGHKTIDQRKEVAERWKIWRAEKQSRLEDDNGKGLNSASIFAALTELVPDNAVIALDVGNNTYSFGRYFECAEQSVLMSGYLGSIGFAFPAAMGAWAATQDQKDHKGRQVVSISGDGGFGQYAMEFTTAVKYGMNITHILLNNSQLGKISKEQRAGDWHVWQTDLHNLSFAGFARACGGHGAKVTKIEDLAKAVREALAFDGPALVEIISDPDLI